MPGLQGLFLPHQAIGAGGRQPAKLGDVARVQLDTVVDNVMPIYVTLAAASMTIKQLAADIGGIYITGIFIFQLDEAASATSIAQGLPLLARHIGEFLTSQNGAEEFMFRHSESCEVAKLFKHLF